MLHVGQEREEANKINQEETSKQRPGMENE
jgi:hypothetical protein